MSRLRRKQALYLVKELKELDAFPKVPESYVETSAIGGTMTLMVFLIMAVLTLFEFFLYQDTWMRYEYEVDKDFSSKLRISVDVTVAMRCRRVGADIVDRSKSMVESEELQYQPVDFELSPSQQLRHQTVLSVQSRRREDHTLNDVLFKQIVRPFTNDMQPRNDTPLEAHNACRIHGHIFIKKVAGNFHITLGKPIYHPQGHAHFASVYKNNVLNFSHRIDQLSFGEDVQGMVHPLDGTEKITAQQNQLYQYFVTVVPTKLHTSQLSVDTYQYSFTERERVTDPINGSRSVPGIFVRYDLSPLMVTVREESMPLGSFLVRLCGIIGGVFSTTDLLHRLVGFCIDMICCHLKLGIPKPKEVC